MPGNLSDIKKVSETNTDSMNAKKDIVYLFTSTTYPYIKDTLDLLALPPGMNYRFRYDVKWLPLTYFTNNSKTELNSLENKEALIIHIKTEPKSGSIYPDIVESIPIRKATILNTKHMGDFIWINFSLGDWIQYDKPSMNDTEKNPHHNIITKQMPSESQTVYKYTSVIAPNHNLPSIKEIFPDNREVIIKNWTNLISHVKKLPEHKQSIFIKLLAIKDMDDKDKPKPTKIGDDYGFELKSGKSYQIEFLQRYFGTISEVPFLLNIHTNEDEIIKIKSTVQVQGKYDLLKFTIVSDSLIHSRHSFILIRPEDTIPHNFLISRPFYNLKINVRLDKIAILLAVIVGGIVLTGSGNLVQNYSKDLASLLPVLGGISSALAAFFMPKK